jgi:serine/threonine protein kinase
VTRPYQSFESLLFRANDTSVARSYAPPLAIDLLQRMLMYVFICASQLFMTAFNRLLFCNIYRFIKRCRFDHKLRISAKDALMHPYFKDIRERINKETNGGRPVDTKKSLRGATAS